MLNSQVAYFVARSIEERALADQSINPAVRMAHTQLAERYEAIAKGERAQQQAAGGGGVIELDMGEASRSQGFQRFGCR